MKIISEFNRKSLVLGALPKSRALCKPLIAGLLLLVCSTTHGKSIPLEQRSAVRQEINLQSEDLVATMIEKYPSVQKELEDSAGYMTGVISAGTVVLIGGGIGTGQIYDKLEDTRTYVDVKRLDLGAGIGAGRYRYLIIFKGRETLLKFRKGTLRPTLGTESVLGEHGSASSSSANNTYSTYVLSESGASVALSVRLIRVSINYDLTDTGLSNSSFPMSGSSAMGQQVEVAPRIWDHKLPFLAQKVLDEGYDLPLPYGVGLIYAYVEQDQLIESLQVGINGGPIESFDFVAFDNIVSKSDSWQLRYDTWLFPFMNVYAMIGTVDGDVPMDVLLDGDGMLDQQGISCDGVINNPLCKVLGGKTITLPIDATFSGKTYSLGVVLAGGWKSYFVTLPANWTISDMDTTNAEGTVLTISPRAGKLFNLGNYGNLAVFAGGNYLDANLTVTGQVDLPDELLTIDYIIEQANKDRWNAVIGANWDINRHWSLSLEYNGLFGSRESYVASATWRF